MGLDMEGEREEEKVPPPPLPLSPPFVAVESPLDREKLGVSVPPIMVAVLNPPLGVATLLVLELQSVELSTGEGVAAAGPREGVEREDKEGIPTVAEEKRDREMV